MYKTLRALALATLVLAAVPLVAAPAFAQFREFSGELQKHKKGAKGQMVVDNRMGDKVKFMRAETVEVVDETGSDKPKAEWDDLKKGDFVTVSWKFTDKPRKAYKVVVRPAPAEAAEDVE